jgi:hypothetical protein
MAAKSISAEILSLSEKAILTQLLVDIAALRADAVANRAAVVALTAKLDADGGVTDTNYAATINPAALTATATVVA